MQGLIRLLEDLTKSAAVIAVFGYMALRTHLNHLGFSSMSSMGIERYLMEAYALTLRMLVPVLAIWLAAAALTTAVRQDVGIKSWIAARRARFTRALAFFIACVAGVCYIAALRVLSGAGDDILVGTLRLQALHTPRATVGVVGVTAVVASGLVLVKFMQQLDPRAFRRERAPWFLAVGSLVWLGVTIPLLHGRVEQEPEYHTAIVAPVDGPPVCGALVFDDDDRVAIWRVHNGQGEVLVLRKERVISVRTRETINLIDTARAAVTEHRDAPFCE